MIKIALCDDIPEVGVNLKAIIEDHEFIDKVSVECFTIGEELFVNAVEKRYDMIFMDMELTPGEAAGETGMQLSKRIKEVYPDVLLIFFTGSEIDPKELLSCEPFEFINKPLEEREVYNIVDAGIRRIRGWEEKFFKFKMNHIYFQINIREIIFFSSRRPYIEIHATEETVEFRGKMNDVEKEIKKMTDNFIRVNQSSLVNRSYVRNISSKEVVLTNGECISVGRKYRKDFENI